jgi:aspartyl-tRNA(Asn)/glutamyl-tRNA(Gln) amidotransferase subunit A
MLKNKSFKEVKEDLWQKRVSCQELVAGLFKRLKRADTDINSFLSTNEESLNEYAGKIDAKIQSGDKPKPLDGIIFGIKDNIHVLGHKTTCGSKMLSNFVPTYQAGVIDKLIAAGAGIIGKTNCDEFAMGSSNENSAFGSVKNPLNHDYVPGGSSGGSAAAVAAGLCHAALGSDTGGSIRQPASFCGVVGYKPSYGIVSRWGLVAFASSFDQIGPLTNSVVDSWAVLKAIAGHDSKDGTSVRHSFREPDFNRPLSDFIIGLPEEFYQEGLDNSVATVIDNRIKELEKRGARFKKLKMKNLRYVLPVYYILSSAEVSSNLARFDSVRYGERFSNNCRSFQDLIRINRDAGFGDEAKRRILLGTFVLSEGYFDAYYKKAQKIRNLINLDFENAFSQCDVILGPTSPCQPFKLGAKINNPLEMYLADLYTVPVNIAGLPAVSIPCQQGSEGLPTGIQLIAPKNKDEKLHEIARAIEKTTE